MHMRYIRLDAIRKTFSDRYSFWKANLPERLLPCSPIYDGDEELFFTTGMSIDYALGQDENNAPCLFVVDGHRMTSPSFYFIRESGEIQELDIEGLGPVYNPEIPGDRERSVEEFVWHNRQIDALRSLCGFGSTCDYKPTRENAWESYGPGFESQAEMARIGVAIDRKLGKMEADGETFFDDDSPFSPWYPCLFRAFGLDFHSAGHYFMWLRATYNLERVDLAEAAYAARADNPAFKALRMRQEAAPDRRREIGLLYEANRHKFLQNSDLLLALCATRGELVYTSRGDDPWGRTANAACERKGSCLGAALSVLREDFHYVKEYRRQYPKKLIPFALPCD